MRALETTCHIVLPIYLMIAVGYFSKKFGIFGQSTLKEMNTSVFRIFLPLLLFENIYTSDVNFNDVKALVVAVVSVIVIFAISCLSVFRIVSNKSRAATIIQGMYRSNFALLGIALTETLYGKTGIEITGMLVAIIIPLYNVLAVILFESTCQKKKADVRRIVFGIISNPLIIGTCLGLLLNLLHVTVPSVFDGVIKSLSQLATPIALIVMGGSFEFQTAISNRKEIGVVSAMRLVVIPVIFTTAAVLAGFRQKLLYGLFLMYATPTAVASFSMASAMGGDENLAGEIVLSTTVFSMFTLGLGIYILTSFHFI